MLTARLASGAIANLWASFAASDPTADPWTVQYKILGTKGGISYSWSNACFEDMGGPAWGINSYVESFQNFVSHFVGECLGKGGQPLSTLDDAIDALQIIEAAEASIQSGQVQTLRWE